ncbi:MAG: hypothetical protein ACP5JG_10975, partial [Anaerolineae bacterium]
KRPRDGGYEHPYPNAIALPGWERPVDKTCRHVTIDTMPTAGCGGLSEVSAGCTPYGPRDQDGLQPGGSVDYV